MERRKETYKNGQLNVDIYGVKVTWGDGTHNMISESRFFTDKAREEYITHLKRDYGSDIIAIEKFEYDF